MNLKKVNGEGVFTIATEGYPYFSNPDYRIGVEAAEKEALAALYRERDLALSIKAKLAAGEGAEYLKNYLDEIGQEMQVHFCMVASGEESIEDTEEYFTDCTARAELIEKAYTVNNKWIQHMERFPESTELTKDLVKKFVHRFWMKDFRHITVESKWEEWKAVLPADWRVS